MNPGLLIVGGGQAAVQLASTLRELEWDFPITIVGDEVALPYQRPPLSKAFLAGQADQTSLEFRSADYFARERIDVVRGQRITEVTAPAADGSQTGQAVTSGGETYEFTHLALTVGAAPRKLSVPGSDLRGITYLRDLADAANLKEELAAASRVAVIGGGFIGLEAAAVARSRGLDVTVLAHDRLIRRVVAPVMSEFLREAHERRGTKVRIGSSVVGFEGHNGRVIGVELADGTSVPADLVIVGIGAVPRTELAEKLSLVCDKGIVVDQHAQTSHPRVFAAGDCTATPHPVAGGALVRLESVQHAIDQARCAAATIAGRAEAYATIPWFWSNQDTLKLQIAGLSAGFDQTVLRGRTEDEKFSVLYYRDGKLLAVDAVNSPRDFMAVRRALAAGQSIDPLSASDLSTALTPA